MLHAVSTAGSVRGAADVLHVTASAVSQQLSRLEREVGQRLLEPSGRGIRLTDAAWLLAEHTSRLLAQVEAVEADLAGHRGAVTGELRIAAFATAARGLLPATIRALRDGHPDLAVRLSVQEPDLAIPALSRGDVDIAVVQDWPEAPMPLPENLSQATILDDTLDAAVPADHPLAHREVVDLVELHNDDWISWTSGQICHDWITTTLRGGGVEPRIVHTASEHSTQVALVRAGLGTALLPRLGREPIPDGVRIIPIRPTPIRRVHALWRTTATRRPAIGAALDALQRVGRCPVPIGAPERRRPEHAARQEDHHPDHPVHQIDTAGRGDRPATDDEAERVGRPGQDLRHRDDPAQHVVGHDRLPQ